MPDRTLRVGHNVLKLTHSDKVMFPQNGITKGDVVDYYARIAKTMLPLVRGRPVMMQRFPDGVQGESFFQKNVPAYFPHWIRTVSVKKENGQINQVLCENTATLVYLADQACLTPHVWLSRQSKLDHPDRMIFDLDPPGNFRTALEAARRLGALLEEELGLDSFVMTTGSRGLHVIVPLDRRAAFDAVRSFARDVAGLLANRYPNRMTTEQRTHRRRGRLFLDTGRNAYGQTAVAPYALRALPGAPVATPLKWNEVTANKVASAGQFKFKHIFSRLDRMGNPWDRITRQSQSLFRPRRQLDELLEERRNGSHDH